MGTFAETAIVNHRSSFAKRTKVFRFCLQQTNGSLLFPFFCSKQTEVAVFRSFRFPFAEFRKHGNMETSIRKQKHRGFSLIHLPFVICPFVDKENELKLLVCEPTK
jgi:hypothetical protein